MVFLADTPYYLFGLLRHLLHLKCHFLGDPYSELTRQVWKKNVSSVSSGETDMPQGKVQGYDVLPVSVL